MNRKSNNGWIYEDCKIKMFPTPIMTADTELKVINYSPLFKSCGITFRRGASLMHYFSSKTIAMLRSLDVGSAEYVEYNAIGIHTFAAVRCDGIYVFFLASLHRILSTRLSMFETLIADPVLERAAWLCSMSEFDMDAFMPLMKRSSRRYGKFHSSVSSYKRAEALNGMNSRSERIITNDIEKIIGLIITLSAVPADAVKLKCANSMCYGFYDIYDLTLVLGDLLFYAFCFRSERPVRIDVDASNDAVSILITVIQTLSDRQLEVQRTTAESFNISRVETEEYFTFYLVQCLCSAIGWNLTRSVTEIDGNQQIYLRIPVTSVGTAGLRGASENGIAEEISANVVKSIFSGQLYRD